MAEAPRELLADPAVPWHAKAAAAVMWSLVRREDAEQIWWETFEILAQRLGCSPRQARRANGDLCASGWATRRTIGHKWVTVLRASPLPATRARRSNAGDRDADGTQPATGDVSATEMTATRTPHDRPAAGGPDRETGRLPSPDPSSPEEAPKAYAAPEVGDDSFPPTKAELDAWQADDPSGFALSSPEPTSATPKRTAEQRRHERALQAWEAYERHRREAWTKARGRQVTDADVRRVVALHKHIRKRRGLDDESAWLELEAYGREAIDHARAAEQGATGDSPEWAARLVRWRGDGGEWGSKRYEAWAAGGTTSSRARRRGHARAEDQDHTEERF